MILEWTNDGCPFVGKHYDSGNMQALQRKYTGEGDVWLTIASSAPGEQGYVTPAEAKADLARWRAAPSDFLLDPNGAVGRLYDARATPHMVVIDRSGRVAYMGAIDDTPSTRLADIKTAKNYLVAALDEIAAGQASYRRRYPGLWLLDQVQGELNPPHSLTAGKNPFPYFEQTHSSAKNCCRSAAWKQFGEPAGSGIAAPEFGLGSGIAAEFGAILLSLIR